eukprot:g114.t1
MDNIEKVKNDLEYFASRGKGGIREIVACLGRHRDENGKLPSWTKSIRLHGATMNDHADTTLKFLVERVGCDLETRNEDMNNTSLHHGIIWAAVNSIHYLLYRGADFNSLSGEDGLNPLHLAERRLVRLESSTELTAEKKEEHMEKTREIVRLLKGVTEAKSYRKWARLNTDSKYVIKFYPEFVRSESRQKMCVLRRLCLKKRAKMLKKKQYRVREAKRIEKKLEQEEREKMKLKPTFPALAECLEQDGLDRTWARDLKFLNVKTVEDATSLTLSDVGMLGDLDRNEKRKLWMWIKEKQEKLKDFKAKPKKKKIVIKAEALRFMDGLRMCMCEKKMSEDSFSLIIRYLF